MLRYTIRIAVASIVIGLLAGAALNGAEPTPAGAIDFNRARELMQKQRAQQPLTPEEQQYLDRARQEFQKRNGQTQGQAPNAAGGAPQQAPAGKDTTGLKPLPDMTAADRYKGEDGGLYGGGSNAPPAALQAAAQQELAAIQPLDADGRPTATGRIVFISLSMSNATMEFSAFKPLADADPQKSPLLTIVDGAQGGMAMAQWAGTQDAKPQQARPWQEAERRLQAAGVTPRQVQVAWIKLANVRPQGELSEHGKKLERDTVKVLQLAKEHFPNLRLAYLGSRIYGGYASSNLNPEPYAYEGAFVVRWLILGQLARQPELNWDSALGTVKAPLLLWGPYFWADGTTPRQADGLTWQRSDLSPGDGTHPSPAGRQKAANLLLTFFKTDPYARPWFLKPAK